MKLDYILIAILAICVLVLDYMVLHESSAKATAYQERSRKAIRSEVQELRLTVITLRTELDVRKANEATLFKKLNEHRRALNSIKVHENRQTVVNLLPTGR